MSVNRISEAISNTYTSFGSNVLSLDYNASTGIYYMNNLTTATNFNLTIVNINPNTSSYKTFTITLMINVASYIAICNSVTINGSSQSLYFNGGIPTSLTSQTNAGVIMQQISVIYTSSSSTPFKCISNVGMFIKYLCFSFLGNFHVFVGLYDLC